MIPGINKRVLNFYDLMLYVALVRKHARLMVLLVCMSMLAGMTVFVYSKQVFYSKSTIHVDSLSLPLDTDSVYHDGNIASVVAELKGRDVVQRTAARLGVNAEYSDIMNKYIRDLRITPNTAGGLDVEFWSYIRSWPAQWPQAMAEEFMKLRAERREQYRDQIMKSYGDELSQLNQKIDDNQDNKFAYQDQMRFTQASIDVSRLGKLPEQLAQIKQHIDNLDSLRKRLDDPSLDVVSKLSLIASTDADTPVYVGQTVSTPAPDLSGSTSDQASTDPTLAQGPVVVPGLVVETVEWRRLEAQQRELLKQQAALSLIYLPGSQKMAAIQRSLDEVQRNLDDDLDIARSRFDLAYRGLQDQYAELQKQLPEYEAANRNYARIQQEAQLHDAGQLSWASMYTETAKTISQIEYTQDKERVNIAFERMIDAKDIPVSPNEITLFLFSFLAGLIMAFLIPFLIEYLDYTLSNLEEVEATFQMRGLGIIPQLPYQSDQPLLLDVPSDGDERNLIENFRVVRTNLLAMGTLTKAAHVTMVTSAVPKEGKTVISSNLAISFSQTGARTLLIDTDLRRGRLHRLFGLRKSPGLSDFLLSKVPLDEAIRPSGKANLSILSAGQHIDSGTELLGSPNFGELMQLLRSQYDRIIMDTPPVLGLSETSILQNQVDGVLFVIWSGRTPIRNMKTAIDILSANGANFYGFILNRLDLSATTNYYQYYYYSSDYYHSYHALENA